MKEAISDWEEEKEERDGENKRLYLPAKHFISMNHMLAYFRNNLFRYYMDAQNELVSQFLGKLQPSKYGPTYHAYLNIPTFGGYLFPNSPPSYNFLSKEYSPFHDGLEVARKEGIEKALPFIDLFCVFSLFNGGWGNPPKYPIYTKGGKPDWWRDYWVMEMRNKDVDIGNMAHRDPRERKLFKPEYWNRPYQENNDKKMIEKGVYSLGQLKSVESLLLKNPNFETLFKGLPKVSEEQWENSSKAEKSYEARISEGKYTRGLPFQRWFWPFPTLFPISGVDFPKGFALFMDYCGFKRQTGGIDNTENYDMEAIFNFFLDEKRVTEQYKGFVEKEIHGFGGNRSYIYHFFFEEIFDPSFFDWEGYEDNLSGKNIPKTSVLWEPIQRASYGFDSKSWVIHRVEEFFHFIMSQYLQLLHLWMVELQKLHSGSDVWNYGTKFMKYPFVTVSSGFVWLPRKPIDR